MSSKLDLHIKKAEEYLELDVHLSRKFSFMKTIHDQKWTLVDVVKCNEQLQHRLLLVQKENERLQQEILKIQQEIVLVQDKIRESKKSLKHYEQQIICFDRSQSLLVQDLKKTNCQTSIEIRSLEKQVETLKFLVEDE